MKRKILVLAVSLVCLSLTAYGTAAFYVASDTAHNIITTGGVDIILQEWADENKTEPFPENGVTGILPGTSETKIIEVKNKGAAPAYVRVSVALSMRLADSDEAGKTELVRLDIDTENWTERDGFYYYNEPLEPGQVTVPLFTTVSFDGDMDNEYQKSTLYIDVNAYAVQTANNGTSALTAAGWPKIS